MKRNIKKILPALLIVIVAAAVLAIGTVYFEFISQRIYEDSTDHLGEIYGQVNRLFRAFVDRNWELLESFEDYLELSAKEGDSAPGDVSGYIDEKQQYWGFSEFYFISGDTECMSIDGEKGSMDLSGAREMLDDDATPMMAGFTMPDGQEVTVFASSVKPGEYEGFSYDVIAISYTNADLATSLKVDAFSGQSKCFIIHHDGTVLISTLAGGNIYGNYLTYLSAASDFTSEELDVLKGDWSGKKSGLMQCRIGGVDHILFYQPVDYQDYILLSIVPESAVSAGFMSVQKITMNVLIIIFLLIGVTVVTVLLIRNRNENKKSRTELQYRERMFDVLSSSVDDIFIMLDTVKMNIDYVSPNIERLLGIPVESARKNVRVIEKCTVDRRVIVPLDELESIPLNGSRYWECEYMHQSTGERRWYRMTIYRMSIQGVEKYISVMSDRTQEQQMNQKLQEALTAARSANEAKSNFLSNMSHDIRTPMNAIVGFSVLLEKDADKPEKVKEYTRKITASSQHLLSLINDVLDMSKIESGKTSLNVDRFSLPNLLEELNIILLPQAKAKNQDLRISVLGAPPEQVIGDKLRLNQILINLLSNAVKYTPEGGRIQFTLSELEKPSAQYVKLRFSVKDNGIGMSEEFQKKVFAPFSREINSVTNKIQGTGLGMAITKNLVDLMGGIITVESEVGKGSTFTVEMSFALPEKDSEDTWFRGKISRMLAADDEEDVLYGITELMKDTGVEVKCVADGEEAVREVLEAYRSGRPYELILLDWKMPGTDGVEAARQIRAEIGKDVPILVLTSNDWSEIEDEARKAGIDAFMAKPFFVSTLRQTVEPLFKDSVDKEDKNVDKSFENEEVMKGKLFLVAEDNELNAEILTEMLDMEGARCELAVNGQETCEMFERSEPGYYDMILMDVQMPIMNGYDATRRIRSGSHPEAKTIPIAAMTANTFAEDVKNALDSGMDGHLAKPVDMKAVRELVGKLCKK